MGTNFNVKYLGETQYDDVYVSPFVARLNKPSNFKMDIQLDEVETKIKQILLDFCEKYAETGPKLTLRFTGGWVRDKLLKRACHDIDVAIDHTTGEEFATKLHEYLKSQGMSEIGVHKIASSKARLTTCWNRLSISARSKTASSTMACPPSLTAVTAGNAVTVSLPLVPHETSCQLQKE
ncbi:hypothetical protein FF38_06037 [Lucilia cuprina]|uniref:Poly A polymerase head domain-containing protein n=1 Tax=Lucilia cuprina TaxID=7375 RepID=A0A0L0BZY2_LUCCU|nr:hypothetical protein FF38_06037 [Lucilia cuprina]